MGQASDKNCHPRCRKLTENHDESIFRFFFMLHSIGLPDSAQLSLIEKSICYFFIFFR